MENILFDFTSGEWDNQLLETLKDNKRKSYSVLIKKDKAYVSFITCNDIKYMCIYFCKNEEEVVSCLKQNKDIMLDYCYIKDFQTTKKEQYSIDIFSAKYSFLDGSVSFYGTQFGEADFSYSDFCDNKISFENCLFKSHVNFYKTHLGKDKCNFLCARFGGGEIRFWGTEIGSIDFTHALFDGGSIEFLGANADSIIFIHNKLNIHINLMMNGLKELVLTDCIIEKTITINENIKLEELSLSFLTILGSIRIKWCNNIYKAIKTGGFKLNKDKKYRYNSQGLADQFLILKENFHRIGYYEDEDAAYRAYMKFNTNKFPKCFLKVFGFIGGYGTRAWSILIASIVIILGYGAFYFYSLKGVFSCFWDATYQSALTFLTLGFINSNTLGSEIMTITEGFLGLTLMSYFTVSLVRKILR